LEFTRLIAAAGAQESAPRGFTETGGWQLAKEVGRMVANGLF
jgi:hypothetical protein